MRFPQHGVRVGPARHGLGVFSLRRFAAGQQIGRVCGTIIDDPQYESDYCMEIGEHAALEPDAPFRYVNHCCQPNCALVEVAPAPSHEESPAAGELWLTAIRSIPAGAELTIDYGWPAETAIPCDCRAIQCRGWIVAEEQRQQVGGKTACPTLGE